MNPHPHKGLTLILTLLNYLGFYNGKWQSTEDVLRVQMKLSLLFEIREITSCIIATLTTKVNIYFCHSTEDKSGGLDQVPMKNHLLF